MKYILAIDQGTTSSRALIFDKTGSLIFKSQQELKCYFPKEGWVEQDALDIWLSVLNVINDLFAKNNLTYDDIASVGITNQRETTIIWDKKTGMPVHNAIVWQSRQSVSYCEKRDEYKDLIHSKTGLILNPYFSASKIRFILDHIENGQERAEKGELMFGTVDSWLVYKLTKGKVHKTDITNASRTMFYNINTLEYDDELLKIFNIPKCMLPEVCSCNDFFGYATFLNDNLKIHAIAGDQQAALFGQNCFEIGESKSTYGTGCFMLVNIGDKPIFSNNGLITTVGWQIGNKVTYALEGSVFMGGATIQWLRDQLGLIKDAKDTARYALRARHDLGVYVVPAFVGLGAPYWDDECKGAIFGLTRGTTRDHLVRATLNSIAYQVKDIFAAIEEETKINITALKVDGGATANEYLMQFQSDILRINITLPKCLETTALGVAYLAGLGCGFYNDLNEIKYIHRCDEKYTPQMDIEKVNKKLTYWKKAIEVTRMFK